MTIIRINSIVMTMTLINIIVMTIIQTNVRLMTITLINMIVMTIIDILSTSFCPGLGDGWGMKPSLGRPEVNKCKMQDSIVNLHCYFCYVVAIRIYVYTRFSTNPLLQLRGI